MLTTPKLLIVDEVGYLGLDHDQASLLFQAICQRYEKQAATIITSNKAFSDWGHVFAGDAVMASAADRLLHRATVVNIKGESYRMKEKRLTGLFPGAVALTASPAKGGPRSKGHCAQVRGAVSATRLFPVRTVAPPQGALVPYKPSVSVATISWARAALDARSRSNRVAM